MEKAKQHRPIEEFEKVKTLKQDADSAEHNWLLSRGWEYTCSTPGSYWMWRAKWEEQTILVNQSTAARIQESWDFEADRKLHPGDYEW